MSSKTSELFICDTPPSQFYRLGRGRRRVLAANPKALQKVGLPVTSLPLFQGHVSTFQAQGGRSPDGPRPPPRPFAPGRPLRRPSAVPGGGRGLRASEAEAPWLWVLTRLARPDRQQAARRGRGAAGTTEREEEPRPRCSEHAQWGRPVPGWRPGKTFLQPVHPRLSPEPTGVVGRRGSSESKDAGRSHPQELRKPCHPGRCHPFKTRLEQEVGNSSADKLYCLWLKKQKIPTQNETGNAGTRGKSQRLVRVYGVTEGKAHLLF